jgi:hypothetical protein
MLLTVGVCASLLQFDGRQRIRVASEECDMQVVSVDRVCVGMQYYYAVCGGAMALTGRVVQLACGMHGQCPQQQSTWLLPV